MSFNLFYNYINININMAEIQKRPIVTQINLADFLAKSEKNEFYLLSNKSFLFNDVVINYSISNHAYNNILYRPSSGERLNCVITKVSVPKDATIKIVNEKYVYSSKCEVIKSYKLLDIYEFPEYIQRFIAQYFNDLFVKLNKQTPEICKMFLENNYNGYIFKSIRHQTKELCDIALKRNMFLVNYMKKEFRTKELYMDLFNKNSWILSVIPKEHVTYEMCKKFVFEKYIYPLGGSCPMRQISLNYIPPDFQTDELCEEALRVNLKNFIYIHKSKQDKYIEQVKSDERFYKIPELIKYDFYTEDMLITFVEQTKGKFVYNSFTYVSYMHYIPKKKLTEKVIRKIIDMRYIKLIDIPLYVLTPELLLYYLEKNDKPIEDIMTKSCRIVKRLYWNYNIFEYFKNILTHEIIIKLIEKYKKSNCMHNNLLFIRSQIPKNFVNEEINNLLVISVEDDIKNLKNSATISCCQNPLSLSKEVCREMLDRKSNQYKHAEKQSDALAFKYASDEILIEIAEIYTCAYIHIKNKTQDITNNLVRKNPNIIKYVPKDFITQELCNIVIDHMEETKEFIDIPIQFRTNKYYDILYSDHFQQYNTYYEMSEELKEKYFEKHISNHHIYD